MLVCTGAGPAPLVEQGEYGPLIAFLCRMMESATPGAPVWPVPLYRPLGYEISLDDPCSEHEANAERHNSPGVSGDSLPFDGESVSA